MTVTMDGSQDIMSYDTSHKSESQVKLTEIQDLLKAHDGTHGDIDHSIPAVRLRLPGISEILPSLYLSGAGVAIPCFLEQLKITCVINAAPELPATPLPDSKPLYFQVPVLDKGDIDIKSYFDEVGDMIEQVRQTGGVTLVHCVAGVSRSASLCIAYLMKYMRMTLKDAYMLVKSARPQIRPNIGFFRQLISYDEAIFGKASVAMVFKESLGQEIPDVYEPDYKAMEDFYQKHRHRHMKLR